MNHNLHPLTPHLSLRFLKSNTPARPPTKHCGCRQLVPREACDSACPGAWGHNTWAGSSTPRGWSGKPHCCPPLPSTLPVVPPFLACSGEGVAATPLYRDTEGPKGTDYTWYGRPDRFLEASVTSTNWPVIHTRPDPPREEVEKPQEEPRRRRRRNRRKGKKVGGRSRNEEAVVRGLDKWWAATYGSKRIVFIPLTAAWKGLDRGTRPSLPISPSLSNTSTLPQPSSPYCTTPTTADTTPSTHTPPAPPSPPSSAPTSEWVPPLPPAPYLSWRSLAADMRWGCVKSALRVLRGGGPAPSPSSLPAPLPSGPAAPATTGNPKVIISNPSMYIYQILK